MAEFVLQGIVAAPFLPMKPDFSIHWDDLKRYIAWVAQYRPTAIAMNMDASEGPALTRDEQLEILAVCKEAIAGRTRLLSGLMSDWRGKFGAELPFLVVQLANYGPVATQPGESGWAGVRAAQRAAVAQDTHAGLAVTIDIGDPYDIHPTNKQEVGRRLARAARHVVYGESLAPSGSVAFWT